MSFDAYDISLGGNFVRKLGKQKVTSSGEIFRTNTRAPRPRPPKYRAPKHSGKHLIGRQVIIKSIRSAEAQAAGPFPPAELSSVPEGVEEETVAASVLPQKSVEVSPSLSATSSSSNEPSPLLTPAAAPSIPSIKRSFRMRPAAPVIAFGENKLSDSPGAAPSSCILMPVSHIEHELKNPSPWFKSAQIQPLHSVESIAHSDPEFPSLATAQNASIPSSSLKLRGRARGFRPLSQVVSEQSSVVDVAEFLSSDDFVSDSDFDRLSVFSDAPVVVRAPTPAVPSQPSPQSKDADVSDDEWQLL